MFSLSPGHPPSPTLLYMPTSPCSWGKCWEEARGQAGGANTDECIRSDYTVMDETIASVNTSSQGSMQLSSPPQCSFDPAGPGLPRRNLCLTGAARPGNWEPCLALQGGSFLDLGRFQDPACNVP